MKKERMQFQGFGMESVCNFHIFHNDEDQFLVVEQLKDTTTSITNRIEEIVPEICSREKLKLNSLKVFEYYPTDTLGEQYIWEVARVKFSEDGDPFWFRPNEADLTTVKNNVVTG